LQVDTQPFTQSGGSVNYNGDQGTLDLQVSASRTMPVSVSGSALFMAARTGDGNVTARAGGANSGTGVIAGSSTAGAMNGHAYTLTFTSPTQYDVTERDAQGNTVGTVTGQPYSAGGTISLGGMQMSIRGTPAATDTFTLAPSRTQDLFATLANLVTTLRTASSAPGASTTVANGIAASLQDLDQGLESVLTLRSTGGAQMTELDTLASATTTRSIQDKDSLSAIVDVDYNKALSDFSRQQVALQAAQQSFAKVSGLTLFDYLKF
jgi:flagellar hook-associated protein 3 FlgL